MKERKGWSTTDGNVFTRKTDLFFQEPRSVVVLNAVCLAAIAVATNS